MTSLTKADIESFSTRLQDRRQELELVRQTASQSADVVELDQARVGRLSRMDALQAQAMSVETLRRREIELQRIYSALQRIQAGQYGECLNCGDAIGKGRLQVDPATPVCLQCAG